MRAAPLGWATYGEDPSVNELQERMADLLGKEAALWVPTCGMANLVALLTIAPRGSIVVLEASSHVLTSEEMGIEEIAGLEPQSLWAADGRLDPAEVEHLIVETGAKMLVLENTHTRAGGTVLTPELTTELAGAGAAPRSLRAPRRGAALQRRGRARDPGVEAHRPGEHGGGQPEQGPVRADGDDPRGPHASDRAGASDAASARRGERPQGRYRRRRGARRARHARRPPRRRPPAGARVRRAAQEIPGLEVEPAEIATNIVLLDVSGTELYPDEFLRLLAERGVLGMERDTSRVRFVTHRLIGDDEVSAQSRSSRRWPRSTLSPRERSPGGRGWAGG